jgi:uncharacterized protein YxeA
MSNIIYVVAIIAVILVMGFLIYNNKNNKNNNSLNQSSDYFSSKEAQDFYVNAFKGGKKKRNKPRKRR